MVNFVTIWNNHPGFANLCDFSNQCAVRMGTALMKSKINMSSFGGVKCWDKEHKSLNHTLRAQELADWMAREPSHFGNVDVITKNTTYKDFTNRKGLVFFQDGWGPTDHIDIWNGSSMKAGSKNYFTKAKEVWFWDLP